MKKNFLIKSKIINHILKNGKKNSGEILLLKSFKKLQKSSKKQTSKLVQLSIINSTPIFKLHKSSIKKNKRNKKVRETPTFIVNPNIRTSMSIKFILLNKEKKSNNFQTELTKKILLTSNYKDDSIVLKNELQKKVVLNKKYLKYYRWT